MMKNLILISGILIISCFTLLAQENNNIENVDYLIANVKENIVYFGVDNPIKVVVSNYDMSEINVEVEGAKEDAAAGGYAVEQSEEFKKKQQELIQQRAIAADVVIATAQIPGRKAPVLLLKETVNAMKPGSVIVDLAASTGGNCELTENGKNIIVNGITIIGKSDFPSDMPGDASKMFGNNIINLLKIMVDTDAKLILNMEDDIIKGTTAVHGEEYISDRIKQMLNIK